VSIGLDDDDDDNELSVTIARIEQMACCCAEETKKTEYKESELNPEWNEVRHSDPYRIGVNSNLKLKIKMLKIQYDSNNNNHNLKHWDSAYLRQDTSYQCRHLANQFMPVNHFP